MDLPGRWDLVVHLMVETEENQQRMLSKTLSYISHHAIAMLALVCSLLALAGASYAATQLPKNSVGNAQIQQGAVAPPKFSKQIGGYVRMYAKIDAAGRLVYSSPQAKLVGWTAGAPRSGGTIYWKPNASNRCIALSTAQDNFLSTVATSATVVGGGAGTYKTHVPVQIAGPAGVVVAVVC
jgi:hypothetical protein